MLSRICIERPILASVLSIILTLAGETLGFFREVPVLSFLFGTRWAPLLEPRSFGVLPLVSGSFLIVMGSSLIALPVGLASAAA